MKKLIFIIIILTIFKSSINITTPHVANGVDYALITMEVLNEDGDPIRGLKDEDFCISATGFQNIHFPVEESPVTGTYKTMLATLDAGSQIVRVVVNGVFVGQEIVEFTLPERRTATLKLVKGEGGYPGEDWDNAIVK